MYEAFVNSFDKHKFLLHFENVELIQQLFKFCIKLNHRLQILSNDQLWARLI